MASFNKVMIMGNLTRDPELRVAGSGINICKFTVATTRKFKGSDDSMREETAFIDVDAFGRQAEVISKYFNKGKPIFVEGRLKLDQWESSAGEKRSKLGVVLENFQFIGGRDEGDSSPYAGSTPPARKESPVAAAPSSSSNDFDEDVPF